MKVSRSTSNFLHYNSKDVDLSFGDVYDFTESLPKDNKVTNLILTRQTDLQNLPMPLPNVRTLKLSANQLSDLPPQMIFALQSYTKMNSLDLSVNKLKTLPVEFKKFKNLETLNLHHNQISEDSDFDIPSLQHVILTQNQFKCIPKLPQKIKSLTFDYNFCRKLHDVNLPNLVTLSLVLTDLESVSPSLYFPKLEKLDLSMNKLTSLPDLSKMTPNLQVVNLSTNFFYKMPTMPQSIREISISHNKLTELPEDLCKLNNLNFLNIAFNNIEKVPALPESIETFKFCNNNVYYVTPCKTPKLKKLFIRYNKLRSFPQYERLKVREFLACSNYIEDLKLINFCDILTKIDFSYNGITEIPPSIFGYSKLQTLILSNNSIKTIPSNILKAKSLSVLQISCNQISEIPKLPPTITAIYAGYCKIKVLPDLSSLKNLEILCLPGNQITNLPELPNSIKSIWLARNKINTLPTNIPKNVIQVDFSYNKINHFPENLCLPQLEELDLTHNKLLKFTSNFTFPALRFLRLAGNPINCELSADKFNNLEIVDTCETKLVFKTEPSIRQFLVSEVLPQYQSRHVKKMTTLPWLQFSETMGVRNKMEDSLAINAFINGDVDLYTIFDGHRGNMTSAFASLYLVDTFVSPRLKLTKNYIYRVIKKLNRCLRSRCYADGATMATVAFNGKKLISAHVGDARTLVVDEAGKISFTTIDHKATDRLEFERIHNEGGRVQNGRIHGILAPGRSLGDFHVLANSDEPEINEYLVQEGDKWIISACDGIFDVLSNEEIGEIASKAKNAGRLATDIKNLAYTKYSTDNLSVIVVDIKNRKVPDDVKHINDEEDEIPKIRSNNSLNDRLLLESQQYIVVEEEKISKKPSNTPPLPVKLTIDYNEIQDSILVEKKH